MAPLRRKRDGPAFGDGDKVFQLAKGETERHAPDATPAPRRGKAESTGERDRPPSDAGLRKGRASGQV